MGSAPSEFNAFVAFGLMTCLLVRTADAAQMDCANYCRHVNSGNIPYQTQMYGACGCDYQPYYSMVMPKYNYAPGYRPSYPMLRVQDLSTTVRTIPFNRQPDGTGIYYLPAEMQWRQNYQNNYVKNDFLNPGQMQNRPKGKLVFIPEDSSETKQYDNYDSHIHQYAPIDARPPLLDGNTRDIMRGNDDNMAAPATPTPDDHHHSYMDVGFRNLLSKNKHNKAKETLAAQNMTANEHHLKNCLELTNLIKSRILHKEDERKGNETLLQKYKKLSNEAVNEKISKSCQHSSDVLEKDVKTIKTFKRPAAKNLNKEKVTMNLDRLAHPPLSKQTSITHNSATSDTKTSTDQSKASIAERPENVTVETSIESVKEFDDANLMKNEGDEIDDIKLRNSPTRLNTSEGVNENENFSTVNKSAVKELFDEINNMPTRRTENDDMNLRDIFNETGSNGTVNLNHENATMAVIDDEGNARVTAADGDININDANVNTTTKGKDDDDEAKVMGRFNDRDINDTHVNPTMATDDVRTQIYEIDDNKQGKATTKVSIGKGNDSANINSDHVRTTTEATLVNLRLAGLDDVNTITTPIIELNEPGIYTPNETDGSDENNELILKVNAKKTKTSKEVNDAKFKLPQNKTERTMEELYETIKISQNKTDGENAFYDVARTNGNYTTMTTKESNENSTLGFDDIIMTTTPAMDLHEPVIYTTHETDSSGKNNEVAIKIDQKKIKNSKEVNDEKFKLSLNKTEPTEKLDGKFEIPQNKTERAKEFDNSATMHGNHINITTEAIDENSTLMGFDDANMTTIPPIEINESATFSSSETDNNQNNEVAVRINPKETKISKEVNDEKFKLPQNETGGVKEFHDSTTIHGNHINMTTKATDENLAITQFDDGNMTTTPLMGIYEPAIYTTNETDSSDENNEVTIKVNPEKTKSSKEVNDETFMLPQNKTAQTEKLDESLEIPQNKTEGAKGFDDSAPINGNHINVTTKATDENPNLMGLDNDIVSTTPVMEIYEPTIYTTNETESSDENNESTTKVNPKKTKISKEVNDVKLKLSPNKTERTKKLDEKFDIPQNTTDGAKEFDDSANIHGNHINIEPVLGYDDANMTIKSTMGVNGLQSHDTDGSNENNELIRKVNPKITKTPKEVSDEKFKLPQNKTEGTEGFDYSLQVIPATDTKETSLGNYNLSISNKNESDTAIDDATMKTADYYNLGIPTNKSDRITEHKNTVPSVATNENEATQGMNDINSRVSANNTVDTDITPVKLMLSEQHATSEGDNNDSAKSLDVSESSSESTEKSNRLRLITVPTLSPKEQEGTSSNKSKLGKDLDTNKLMGEVGTTVPLQTVTSVEPTSTEPTTASLAMSNDWETKPAHSGLNSLLNIKTLHQSKGVKEKNMSPETDKDNKLITVKMLPDNIVQDSGVNDYSETKEPDLNTDDELSEFAISTLETPYNLVTNTETVGGEEGAKTPSNFGYRVLPRRKHMKSDFNEKQKLLQNSFPNTTNTNHTIQSTKRHTTIGADSLENMNSRQYVATTNNPIKSTERDNRRSKEETPDTVTPKHRNKIIGSTSDRKRTTISDNERIAPNIVTKETNRGIITSMKDELVSSDELQTGATLRSVYIDESVTDLGEYPDDIPIQYNGQVRRKMNNKEEIPNQTQNIASEQLPTELRHPADHELLSALGQQPSPPHPIYTQPILTGKMYLVQNNSNLIPLKFIQKPNGNIALGIDANHLCKNLLGGSNENSVLLNVLCNKKIPNDDTVTRE